MRLHLLPPTANFRLLTKINRRGRLPRPEQNSFSSPKQLDQAGPMVIVKNQSDICICYKRPNILLCADHGGGMMSWQYDACVNAQTGRSCTHSLERRGTRKPAHSYAEYDGSPTSDHDRRRAKPPAHFRAGKRSRGRVGTCASFVSCHATYLPPLHPLSPAHWH